MVHGGDFFYFYGIDDYVLFGDYYQRQDFGESETQMGTFIFRFADLCWIYCGGLFNLFESSSKYFIQIICFLWYILRIRCGDRLYRHP